VAPLVEEDPVPGSLQSTPAADKAISSSLSVTERAVLEALTSSHLTLRTITGIAQECKIEQEKVAEAINALIAKNLAGQTTNERGKLRWFSSAQGRAVSAHG
jgi:DNA-binding MarR family transcriptional regulator